MTAQAHEPDFSLSMFIFYFINSSSAYLNPNLSANSGLDGKYSYSVIYLCKLSLRKSAQAEPPCPSKTAKNVIFFCC
jgi:hypothetical protein